MEINKSAHKRGSDKTADYKCLNDCFASCENIIWIAFKTIMGSCFPPDVQVFVI